MVMGLWNATMLQSKQVLCKMQTQACVASQALCNAVDARAQVWQRCHIR